MSALHYHLIGRVEIKKDFSAARNGLLRQLNFKAIEADANSQFGYIGLAWSYRNAAIFGWHEQEYHRDEVLKRAAYADKGILLAPDDAEAHSVRASIHTEAGGDRAGPCTVRPGDRPEPQRRAYGIAQRVSFPRLAILVLSLEPQIEGKCPGRLSAQPGSVIVLGR